MKTRENRDESGRASLWLLVAFFAVAVVLLPLAAVLAADITPGYTFTSGEQNVTHTKLNNAAAGSINTTFFSGKPATTDPTTTWTILIHDVSSDIFKKATLANAVFDHSALLAGRSTKTTPAVADLFLVADSAAANAYKAITLSNALFSGGVVTGPTNETQVPVIHAGAVGSLTLSNLLGSVTLHSLPTNGDVFLVITENGRAVKGMSLQSLITGAASGTNYAGTDLTLTWDGTRLRATRATNMIDGLTMTNTVPATNDALAVLQSGVLKKLFLNELRSWVGSNNIVQAKVTNTFTLAPGGSWTDVTGVTVSITPRTSNSLVLVRAVLLADADAANAHFKIMRDAVDIALGDVDGANRMETTTSIENGIYQNVVMEWLDSPSTTAALTYKVQVMMSSGSVRINGVSGDANSVQSPRGVSTLTVEEVFR